MSKFVMPSLGADMEAGKLVEWLVEPGAPIKRGDIIAVVETQKGAIEIEVFEDGVFERSLVAIGDTVPVGTAMAVIRHDGEAETPDAAPTLVESAPPPPPPGEAPVPVSEPAPTMAEPPTQATAPEPVSEPAKPEPEPEPVKTAPGRIMATPAARSLAKRESIDLSAVQGSGPRGEIVLADIAEKSGIAPATTGSAAERRAEATKPAGQTAMSGMRAAIAAAMTRSKREIPHYYLSHSVELTAADTWLAARNAGREPADRLLLGALFVKAVALAARKYPEFNGYCENGTFAPAAAVHTGVAINIRGGGLVAPAIHDADQLSLPELMTGMIDLVARVRAGRFRGSELSDPTITISSLGERGVEVLYGVIYPPQVAIVGFGTPVTRAWAADGMVGARRVVSITLAGDHRVSDGHRGALFLNHIGQLLERPETL